MTANRLSIAVALQRFSARCAGRAVLAGGLALGVLMPVAAQPAPRPADSAAQAEAAYHSALRAHQAGQTESALSTLEHALRTAPTDLRLRFLRAVILAERGERDAALAAFEALAEAFPELPEPHNNLAVLRASAGDLVGARQALEAALRAAPNYPLAHENLGDLALHSARAAYERAQQLDPQRTVLTRKLEIVQAILKLAPLSPTPRPGAQPQVAPE